MPSLDYPQNNHYPLFIHLSIVNPLVFYLSIHYPLIHGYLEFSYRQYWKYWKYWIPDKQVMMKRISEKNVLVVVGKSKELYFCIVQYFIWGPCWLSTALLAGVDTKGCTCIPQELSPGPDNTKSQLMSQLHVKIWEWTCQAARVPVIPKVSWGYDMITTSYVKICFLHKMRNYSRGFVSKILEVAISRILHVLEIMTEK